MNRFVLLLFGPLTAFALYLLVSKITKSHRQAATAKKLGCKPPPVYTTRDPIGLENILELTRENDAGHLPQHIAERFDRLSKREGYEVLTSTTHIFRNWLMATRDPKNVQAILATQFKEFSLGPIRFGTFSPL